jgi:hypothetical protein
VTSEKSARRWVAGAAVALAAAVALIGSAVPASATTSPPLPHHRGALITVHLGRLWPHHLGRHLGAGDRQHRH